MGLRPRARTGSLHTGSSDVVGVRSEQRYEEIGQVDLVRTRKAGCIMTEIGVLFNAIYQPDRRVSLQNRGVDGGVWNSTSQEPRF